MTPEQIRESHNRQIEKIRARQDLTVQAKQVAMARVHQTTVAKLDAAHQADQQRYQQRAATLEKRLFGNRDLSGADAISARDARERVTQYTHPDEALAAYKRAQRDGDRDMMHALGSWAADQAVMPILGEAWRPLVEAHAEATPGYRENLEELRSLTDPGDYRNNDYMPPGVPSELGRMNAQQVITLANSELTVYGNDAPEAA
jgi:hypothetical protein